MFLDTIRNNILFGKSFDEDFYRKVVKATTLDKDLSMLPDYDLTFVGESGITLSGG